MTAAWKRGWCSGCEGQDCPEPALNTINTASLKRSGLSAGSSANVLPGAALAARALGPSESSLGAGSGMGGKPMGGKQPPKPTTRIPGSVHM